MDQSLFERDHFLIGGRAAAPLDTGRLEVVCPSTEAAAGFVPRATPADIDAAVVAARLAFDAGPWRHLSVAERSEIVLRACERLDDQVDDIALVLTTEMGSPITKSRRTLVAPALAVARGFVQHAKGVELEEHRHGMAGDAIVLREPVGVVAAIAPWNGPFAVAIAKVVPALLMGCTVVFKPAAETPLDAYWLVEALQDAGLPDGVLNLVPGGREVGSALVAHPGVDKVSFTGSTAAGRLIGAICGQHLKRMQLELGGKSAGIVFGDADLDAALPALSAGAFGNTGQVCASLSRVLVERSRYDEVVDGLAARAQAQRVGDPFDPGTQQGPLVSAGQRERVEGYIEIGRAEGATLVTGGGRPEGLDRGWYVEPTVFANGHNAMRIAQEEIFGPVVVVVPFDGEDEAVRLANDSPFGLHGAVFTTDAERALDIARRIDTGTFTVNGFTINPDAPFGGVKSSGVGREFGPEGLSAYLEHKTINVPTPR